MELGDIKMSGDKCDSCQLDKNQCKCQSKSNVGPVLQTSIKPPDLFVDKQDLSQYERKLRRWSRACGVDPKHQGDIILIHPSQTNPSLHDRLDREIGEKLENNPESIDLIISTLKQWFGVNKGVDLMKIFNDFVNSTRKPSQNLHEYVAAFEANYNQLEKLGEKLSSRLLALFLLKNANLSDTEFQIITANLNFSSEDDAQVKQLYQDTKDALNKHQNCQVINAKSQNKTFFLNNQDLDSLTEEQTNELVLWLKKKQKSTDPIDDQPPAKKWHKCKYCLCDCQPKWKKCDCECSKHPHWKCPNKPSKSGEAGGTSGTASCSSKPGSNTKSASNLNNLSSFLTGNIKKIPSTKSQNRQNDDVVQVNHQLTLLTNKSALSGSKCGNKHELTIDTACPTSLVGAKYFKSVFQSYPESVSSQFQSEPSNRTFQFGGGETTVSLGKYTFPVYVMDNDNNLHIVNLAMEVVEVDIIMLLGANSLNKGGAILDLGNLMLTLPETFGAEIQLPINFSDSGHFKMNFFTLAKEEGYEAAQIYLTNTEWSKETASSLLNYVKFNKEPRFQNIVQNVYYTKKSNKVKSNSNELNQKDINKLHQLFGHAHPDKLEKLIKSAGKLNDKVKEMLQKLMNCEVCKIEGRRVPKPKVALPKAAKHNHVVSADLKENTRYPGSQPYILYLVDCFSRFKVATFIPDKKSSTVTEAILVNWVKLFGPMKYLHVDRGREWMNNELQNFCHKFDIRLTATAAMTPNANGICERQHAVCDRMMDKMITADPTLSPEMALCWSVWSANCLELTEGVSPFTIVFGRVPMHPTLMDFKPGNEEDPEVSKVVADNIKTMLKAREEFVAVESDRVLRQALKQRIYSKSDNVQSGDWIYYRNNSSSVWKGPVKVTTREGKRIYVLNGGRLNTINLDDILLCKSDDDMWMNNDDFVTAPKPAEIKANDIQLMTNNEVNVPKADNTDKGLEYFTFSTAPQSVPESVPQAAVDDHEEVVEIENESEVPAVNPPEPSVTTNKPKSYRVTCNTCSKSLQSTSVYAHAKRMHGLRGTVETLSTPVAATPNEDPEINNDEEAMVFFTSEPQEADDEVYLTIIPRSRHNEAESIQAKEKELENFTTFDVYEEVTKPADAHVITTQWVIVDKETEDGKIVRKARLCMRGDNEKNKHLIPTDSPTVNKITLKLMLTIAASKGWEIRCSDISRAFLQTEDINRDVFVIPPPEAQVKRGIIWKLKRAAYGLIDSSRGFFLNHSSKLQDIGFEALKMDPAAFVLKSDDEVEAITASHVDDTITVSSGDKSDEIMDYMSEHFKYGESTNPPCRYLGSNISRSDNDIILDQDHYVQNLEIPDMSAISHLKRDEILPVDFQTKFRSLASKLNMLALSSRPDIMFDAKVLTSKYGSATKRDMIKAVKMIRKVKDESTTLTLPDIGDIDDWILVGVTDASNKTASQIFAVGGFVVMLVNKITNRSAVLTWSSKKIDRVCRSSLAAETLSLQNLAGSMFYVRQILKQMFGNKADSIPGLALTDNQDLYSCVHNLKACEDKRLLADIINIKQAIADDKTITELRYIPKEQMISDCLTKSGKLGEDLLKIVRTGVYNIPGGVKIRDSTKLNIRTWQQLMNAEKSF